MSEKLRLNDWVAAVFVFLLASASFVSSKAGFQGFFQALLPMGVVLIFAPLSIRYSHPPEVRARDMRRFKRVACGIVAGLLVGMLLVPSVDSFLLERAQQRGDRIIAALLQHREEQGAFPRRLDDLVPEYLEEIPLPEMELLFSSSSFYYSGSPTEGFGQFNLCFHLEDGRWIHHTGEHGWGEWEAITLP